LFYKENQKYRFTPNNYNVDNNQIKNKRLKERVIWGKEYYVIPYEVYSSTSIKSGAKLLFAIVNSLSKNKIGCIASNQYFQEIMGVSKNSISNWVKDLNKNDFLDYYQITPWYGGNRRTIRTKNFSKQ